MRRSILANIMSCPHLLLGIVTGQLSPIVDKFLDMTKKTMEIIREDLNSDLYNI